MPNVIKSLLVGIGFDLDKESMGKVESGFDSIISKGVRLGAVLAGAYGIKEMVTNFAQATDALGKFAQINGVTADQVNAFGNALEAEGGSLQEAMSAIESINRIRDQLRRGEAGIFADAGLSNFDATPIIEAKDAMEALYKISEQYSKLDQSDQRSLRGVFGFGDAAMRLLSQGRPAVEAQMSEYGRMRPITDDMTKNAAEFNTELHKLTQNLAGFSDIIANDMTGTIARALKKINNTIDKNRDAAVGFVEAEMNSWRFLGDLLTGNDVGHYSIGGMRFDQMDDFAINSAKAAFQLPDFESMYRKASGFISDGMPEAGAKMEVRRGGFGAPLVPSITIPVILDGKTIEKKVIDVNGRLNKQAVDDLSSVEDN